MNNLRQPRVTGTRVPRRYAPVLSAFLMSGLMALLMSGVLIALNTGVDAGFPHRWLRADLLAWPLAFPAALMIAPVVQRIVARLTA